MSESQPSDAEVVREVLDGDPEAYGVLVRRYQDVLFQHAERMLGGPDAAADVVQDAFVRGYRKLDRCREPERVGGWLFRITSNLCKDRLRSRDRQGISLEDAPPLQSGTGDPGEAARRTEVRDDLRRALDRLSPEKREAFLLKHLRGHTYEEMSAMLEVSVSALKMRVHRAREELQDLLVDYR